MSKREAEKDLEFVRAIIKAWCTAYNANARLEVCYHADLDDDNTDGE